MSSSHSWEGRTGRNERHAWERRASSLRARADADPDDPWGGSESSDSELDDDLDPIAAAENEFCEYMLRLYRERALSARQFCVAMYYAGCAGNTEAAKYGLHPGASTGH